MYYRAIVILLLFILTVVACEDTGEKRDYTKRKTLDRVQDTLQETVQPRIVAWQGNIDGRYPVLVWYRMYDGALSGYLFYTDNKKHDSIAVLGTYTDSTVRMLEMWPDGNVTGIWDLDVHNSSSEGSWFSPETRRVRSASLMHIDTAVSIPRVDSAGDISGSYRYQYSKDGYQGNLEVKKVGDRARVSFSNVTEAPAYNLADLGPFEATVTNNVITYQSKEFGDCSIRIRFYNGFAVVDYVDNNADCGFGHRATVAGVYVKEKTK